MESKSSNGHIQSDAADFSYGTTGGYGKFIVDVDIGGTFTDCVVSRENRIKYVKTETTPHDLSLCLKEVLMQAGRKMGVSGLTAFLPHTSVIRLSTSLSINLLVERKGGPIGLMVTPAWRSGNFLSKAVLGGLKPLILEEMVMEVEPDINPDEAADKKRFVDDVREKVHLLLERGARIIVMSMSGEPDRLKDYENQAKAIIDRFYPGHFLGSVPVLLSHQVSSHDDYGVRTHTALLNAYCLVPLSESFYRLQEYLRTMEYKWPLQIVHSSGGSSRVAKTKAVQTLNSGSAAGIFGLERLTTSLKLSDLLTVDIGGTSSEIGMISEHSIQYASPAVVDGMSLDIVMPILSTLGIGGSTVAALGDDGEITLGPDSVGVYPGPACYGLGGTHPTLTDAYLSMGYLSNDYYLGGKKRIHLNLAEKAFIYHLADPLGIPVAEAANRVKQKAVEIIAGEMQAILAERNLSVEDLGVAAIGGGGGCLAAGLADHLGATTAYLFRLGSVFGAFGSSDMDLLHEYEHKIDLVFAETTEGLEGLCHQVNLNVKNLQRIAFKDMRGEGFRPEEICFRLELEFVGDDCERPVRMPCDSPFLWYDRHGPGIGRFLERKITPPGGGKKLSKIRLRALASIPHTAFAPVVTQNKKLRPVDERNVYLGQGHRAKVQVFRWDDLPPTVSLDGPAIVESEETTIFLPEDRTIAFDRYLTGIIRTKEAIS